MLGVLITASLIAASGPVPLAASVLPPSRHATVGGDPVTFFATIANAGSIPAENCRIEADIPGAVFTYRAYDVAAGAFIAEDNTPVDISAGSAQVFVLGVAFSAPIARTDFEPGYACDNGEAVPVHGVTQITLTATGTPEPDILMLASTGSTPGINTPIANGNSVFAVALMNLNGEDGVSVPLEFSADLLDRTFHVVLETCEIDETAQCLTPRAPTTLIELTGRESRSFAVWVGGHFSLTPRFYDMVRLRALVRDQAEILRGSTSVAHSGVAFRNACIGDIAAEPWSGTIRYQTAAGSADDWIFTTQVHDLNFYSDGLGNIYAVPISGEGSRFSGSVPGSVGVIEQSCLGPPPETYSLTSVTDGPGGADQAQTFSGVLRRNLGSVTGSDTRETDETVVESRLRAFYTNTDVSVHPLDFVPNSDTLTTPPEGIEGQYSVAAIDMDGVRANAGIWQVTPDAVAGSITYPAGAEDVNCELSLGHSGVVIPTVNNDLEPNSHYRVLDGTLANCTGGDSSHAFEGNYHGLMIYQPLVSIGEPLENGLEIVLSREDGEDDYLLWFVLRTSEE